MKFLGARSPVSGNYVSMVKLKVWLCALLHHCGLIMYYREVLQWKSSLLGLKRAEREDAPEKINFVN